MGTPVTLARLEQILADPASTAAQDGAALAAIRDTGLWAGQYGSFPAYLETRWHLSPAQSQTLVSAAVTAGTYAGPPAPAGGGGDGGLNVDPPASSGGTGLVQGMTDRSEVILPLALLNNPGGVSDDAGVINESLLRAVVVRLVPGLVYTTASLISVPAGKILMGRNGYRTSAGPVIQGTGLTSGAVIQMGAGTPAGTVMGVTVDGSLLPAGAVDGIGCYVNCKQGSIIDTETQHFTQHGINITQNGGNPDGWLLRQITSHNNAGNGVNWDYSVDGQFDTFHLDNNTGHGLALGTMNNCTFIGGKCQQNAASNYGLTGGFIKSNASFVGCLSENSQLHGWDFHGVNGQGTIKLIGCSARDEGTSGTSGSGFAGFNLGTPNTNMFLVLSACDTYVTASAAGQDYGVLLTGHTGWLTVEGGTLIGSVAGYHDGGGNTASQQLFDNVLTAVGQVGSLASITRVNT